MARSHYPSESDDDEDGHDDDEDDDDDDHFAPPSSSQPRSPGTSQDPFNGPAQRQRWLIRPKRIPSIDRHPILVLTEDPTPTRHGNTPTRHRNTPPRAPSSPEATSTSDPSTSELSTSEPSTSEHSTSLSSSSRVPRSSSSSSDADDTSDQAPAPPQSGHSSSPPSAPSQSASSSAPPSSTPRRHQRQRHRHIYLPRTPRRINPPGPVPVPDTPRRRSQRVLQQTPIPGRSSPPPFALPPSEDSLQVPWVLFQGAPRVYPGRGRSATHPSGNVPQTRGAGGARGGGNAGREQQNEAARRGNEGDGQQREAGRGGNPRGRLLMQCVLIPRYDGWKEGYTKFE